MKIISDINAYQLTKAINYFFLNLILDTVSRAEHHISVDCWSQLSKNKDLFQNVLALVQKWTETCIKGQPM